VSVHASSKRLLAAAAAALVALSLAACGRASQAADTRPIEDQLGFDQNGIQARQARAENYIRDCMEAQGFDYVPVDPAAQAAALRGQAGMSEEDFNRKFGFGITTLYEQTQAGKAAGGPNEKYRASLGPADRAAYDKALRGEHPDADFATALDNGDYSRLGGCTKEATEKVFGGLEVLSDLQTKLDDLAEKILADPRMVKAVADWSDCMRRAGYDVHYQDEVDAVLKKRLEAIVGPPDAPRAGYDHAALAALQKDEVTLVGADLDCEARFVGPVDEKVRGQYEQAFREQNAELLSKVPSA
jgi:ABC-type amino acid transport substrate-binding protein